MTTKDNALPIVTCDKVYYAKKTTDGYETPVYIENLTEIGVEKNFGSSSFHAEGTLKYTDSTLSDIPITISTGDLIEEIEVDLMGHKVDSNGLIVRSKNDIAPDVAILFTVKKADGVYKGYVFYDGKFTPSGINAATSEGSANYQTKTITGVFKPLDDGVTDVSKVMTTEAEVEEFFKAVPKPDFSTPTK